MDQISSQPEHPKQSGLKFDQDKPELFYNPPEFQYGAARAFMYGAKKYGAWNWLGGLSTTRLWAGICRHLLKWMWEQTPDESGLDHLDHAAAGIAMLMETVKQRPDLDDRPPIKKPTPERVDWNTNIGCTLPYPAFTLADPPPALPEPPCVTDSLSSTTPVSESPRADTPHVDKHSRYLPSFRPSRRSPSD